mmetsp:Transcript_3898/g.5667  ORF Transcript_3898/g.5667 Transcript_3898/m.5667 type:complete len:355 (-) Transcript_3898:734-1798(-)
MKSTLRTCRHLRAPIGGRAFDVFLEALSGVNGHAYLMPESFGSMPKSAFEKYIATLKGKPDDRWSAEPVTRGDEPIGEEKLAKLFRLGALYCHSINACGHALTKRLGPDDVDKEIQKGTYLRIFTNPKRHPVDYDAKKSLVFEAEDFVVVEKPSGLPSVAGVDNFVENLAFQTQSQLGMPLWPVQRLDIPTTGLVTLAKSVRACTMFHEMFKKRDKVDKYYQTIVQKGSDVVERLPEPGTRLTHWQKRSPRAPMLFSKDYCEETGFTVDLSMVLEDVAYLSKNTAEVKIKLLTGRTHQIRGQMALLGWPLRGDTMYNGEYDIENPEKFNPEIHLRAYRLKFTYPGTGESYDFTV